MLRRWSCCLFLLASMLGAPATGAGEPAIETLIGGVGGVYFLAEPGELVVNVEKRDRNRSGAISELRAVLAGPDRQVLAEAAIPDDGLPRGKFGPPQRVRLATRVERKGVFVLNVTVSQDRYGEGMVWGFSSNCPRYLIETARGHRDRRHDEPLVLLNPERPGSIAFLPRKGAFDLEIADLPKAGREVSLYDGKDNLIASLAAGDDGTITRGFPAAKQRENPPWRLALPVQQATVQIDGVTRWDRGDLCSDSCCWTPDPKSFFPWLSYRWLLTPYSRTVYGPAGQKGQMAFTVHNNSDQKRTIRLALEFPGKPWPAQLSTSEVVLRGKQQREVQIAYTVPAEQGEKVHLRATPVEDPDFSTYCTLIVKPGSAPATEPLSVPLVLKPYQHENELLGYLPDYPSSNQVYFDLQNRPWVCGEKGVRHWADGGWQSIDLRSAVTSCEPPLKKPSFSLASSKVAFDRDGDAYLLASAGGHDALLHSSDGGKTFLAYFLPGGKARHGALEMEEFTGHNLLAGPPPVLRYVLTESDPERIFRRVNDLELFLPKKTNGRLEIGAAQIVSRKCIGLANHSGIPSSVASRGDRVHVAWGEATDPAVKLPGLPTFVRSYDRRSGPLGDAVLVAHGPPANDVHNSPSITLDSKGFLHVLAGTHGRPFPYVHSRQANTAQAGFSEAVVTGDGLQQTYIGLVCGPDDTLYAAFRMWQRGKPPFPNSHYATLAFQRKPPGKPWEAPQILVVPPFSEYSVHRHRLTIDRAGRVFLSYKLWSTFWFYRNDRYGNDRALLTTADGGQSWRLARSEDLLTPAALRGSH